MKRQTIKRYAQFAVVFCSVFVISARWAAASTALDDYIAAPDPIYGFSQIGSTISGPGFASYNIDLTSQTWRDPSEVIQDWKDPSDPTQNQWDHKMTIVQPNNLLTTTAILVISGGSGPGSFPDPLSGEFQQLAGAALATNSVIVNLPTVPNERLKFDGESFSRTEDEIIAKTFKMFLDNDPEGNNVGEWPLLLPMVKSAVAAMDATQEHMQNQGVAIDKFFIIGGSKRGWTTWLTAAVEARLGGPNRVSGIAPGVIDFLNIDESMKHHRSVYAAGPVPPINCVAPGVPAGCSLVDGYSLAVGDYVLEGVMQQLAPPDGQAISPRAQELLDIVDPYEYRDRLTLPKYIVNSTGDQFFAPDSSQFYYDDLSGEKYLRYIPNTDHGLDGSAIEGALTFYAALEQGLPLPDLSWEVSADGTSITVLTDGTEQSVLMWEAINPRNRDFRQATFGDVYGGQWNSFPLTDQGNDDYIATISIPETGATAFMVELTYLVGGQDLKFTTEISVVAAPEPASHMLLLGGLVVSLIGGFRVKRGQTGAG